MNTTFRLAALAVTLAASGLALADDITIEPAPAASSLRRADVAAQVVQARADGTLLVTEADFQRAVPAAGSRDRAEVRAGAIAAVASGEARAIGAESSSFDGRIRTAVRTVGSAELRGLVR